MELLKLENFWFFIIIFLPGFISVKVHHLIIADEKYDFSKNLFEIVGYSIFNLILFSWLIVLNFSQGWIYTESIWLYISSIFIVVIGPISWPILLRQILSSKLIKPFVLSNSKSAWDYVFSKREAAWVIVHLKDGRKIGGKFGSRSFASLYPCRESIYIQEVWKLDGDRFKEMVPNTNGLLIISDEILSVEFFT